MLHNVILGVVQCNGQEVSKIAHRRIQVLLLWRKSATEVHGKNINKHDVVPLYFLLVLVCTRTCVWYSRIKFVFLSLLVISLVISLSLIPSLVSILSVSRILSVCQSSSCCLSSLPPSTLFTCLHSLCHLPNNRLHLLHRLYLLFFHHELLLIRCHFCRLI